MRQHAAERATGTACHLVALMERGDIGAGALYCLVVGFWVVLAIIVWF